jgi:hypothetical protein
MRMNRIPCLLDGHDDTEFTKTKDPAPVALIFAKTSCCISCRTVTSLSGNVDVSII